MNKKIPVRWHPITVFGIFVLAFLVARLVPQLVEMRAPLRLAIALLIVPGFLYLVLAQRYWIRRQDELQKRVQIEAFLFAFVVIVLGVLIKHFLLKAGFGSPFECIDVVLLGYVVGVLVGYPLAARRYGMLKTPPL